MNATIKEWVTKAEGDYATAGRELRASESPNYDSACFHAQQSAEKLMKALLIHLGVPAPKTHDLVMLDRLLAPACKEWSWPVEELRFLTHASIAYRYPGESADKEEAVTAFDIATRIREKLRELLPE